MSGPPNWADADSICDSSTTATTADARTKTIAEALIRSVIEKILLGRLITFFGE